MCFLSFPAPVTSTSLHLSSLHLSEALVKSSTKMPCVKNELLIIWELWGGGPHLSNVISNSEEPEVRGIGTPCQSPFLLPREWKRLEDV